ncbi:tetratricopeptide repeat protein [Chryseobacterium sp. MEBOG06]|uniref:tetratricopeptide repeat protein n=1 Tax=unclassified Chryseobacterium TaxID=2593645 RepID=UPI001F26F20E|nr:MULTISPECIES: tetratricopeptide repeat protein [unclassified Chryseobacterium]UKB85562.1 tetratricopeptide repeat protein [Chryseobacterium sp. MEBOG06]
MIKKTITILFFISLYSLSFSQNNLNKKTALQELSENACQCTDSISLANRKKEDIIKDMHDCIDKYTGALQISNLLKGAEKLSEKAPEMNGKKQINLTFNTNKDSQQYKDSYNEIERYLMQNCESLKRATQSSETNYDKFSKNETAIDFYQKAVDASKKEDWKEAIQNYEQALKIDPKFIYAWDNLGICYRRVEEYDKALHAYKQSLSIDPKGKMPLQNIAITYVYKKEYQKAIDAYNDFDKVYPGDPEVYYGMGQVYFTHLKNNEKGLDNICRAYRIYSEQKSPYRSDAETMIGYIYKSMKEEGKSDRFKEILKNNNIKFD